MRRTHAAGLRGVLSLVLALAFALSSVPRPAVATEDVDSLSAMATRQDLLNDQIWLTQSESGKCTLSSVAMMLRRTYILNGWSGWQNITEDAIYSTAWDPAYGLRWSFAFEGVQVAEEDLSSCSESLLCDMLAEHPEGVVIYNWRHAVLLTDYTDGVLYCADPAFGDRRPLTRSSRSVRANNVRQVWYIDSYVADPTDEALGQSDTEEPTTPEPEPEKEKSGRWILSGTRWWYAYYDTTYPKGGVFLIDGTPYCFDNEGWMRTGWWMQDGVWHYSLSSGAIATGWVYDNGLWYWLKSDGTMATGWQKVKGVWYFMNPGGDMRTGWLRDGSAWYLLDASGAMATGWRQVSGTWYYLGKDGVMATGWANVSGTWYYLQASGAMAAGWQYLDGAWYYLYSSGAMAHDCWVGNYYLGADGAMLTDTVTPDGYRVLASGAWDGGGKVR